jgi:TM2 domain-containing membrane protein YozV
MYNNGSYEYILCLFGLIVAGLFIGLIVMLVRKSQEETQQTEMAFMQLLQSIAPEKQMLFQMQFGNFKKSASTALLLCWFLGGFGAHRFYLDESGTGIFYLLFCWTGVPSIIAFIELFSLSGKVNRKNLDKARQIAMMLGGRVF